MDKQKEQPGKLSPFMLIIIAAVIIYIITRNITTFYYIVLVALGFGVMILIHELGHFTVAKLSGIKVEAFSMGYSPILAGIIRTEEGYRMPLVRGVQGKAHRQDKPGPAGIICRKQAIHNQL